MSQSEPIDADAAVPNPGHGSGGRAAMVGGGTGGAGSFINPPPVSGEGWTPLECEGRAPKVLKNVAFQQPFDYVAIFASHAGGMGMGGPFDASVGLLDEFGTACATATDASACDATAAPLRKPSEACVQHSVCRPFLLTTNQDEVTRSDVRSALLTLLGAIDSEYKAAFVAMFDGHAVGCPYDPTASGGLDGNTPLRGTETKPSGDGYDVRTEWQTSCFVDASRETVHVAADGTLTTINGPTMIGMLNCMAGRRPEGLRPAAAQRSATIGAYFADAARLEAASVYAFERLARELAALGAPPQLVGQAAHAALDEIRHARVTGELARRFGYEPAQAHVAPSRPRAALAIALENAVEGCVRETYGALLAHHQAQAAQDPRVCETMQRIAEDETRHAELSWSVARWLEPQLTAAERRTLAAARSAALAQLFTELDAGFTAQDARAIGFPAPEMAARMLARLGNMLGVA